jgi:hypothetical protein
MAQINDDIQNSHPEKIHVIVELPEDANNTRTLYERSTNTTIKSTLVNYRNMLSFKLFNLVWHQKQNERNVHFETEHSMQNELLRAWSE